MWSPRLFTSAVLAGRLSLSTAKAVWSSTPATFGPSSGDDYILKTGYLLGNGKLGAIPFGPPGAETLVLNLDSLWSGGPFEYSNYTGGNPTEPVYQHLPGIREWIFQNGTGNVTALLNDGVGYGSYQTLGNLSVTFDGVSEYESYTRMLDLDTGVHTSSWVSNGSAFTTFVFCSYPALSCVYNVTSDAALPSIAISLVNTLMDSSLVSVTCGDRYARLTGTTQASIGLEFDSVARTLGNESNTCSPDTGALILSPAVGQKSIALVFSAESSYDQTRGNSQDNYSFRGVEPGPAVQERSERAALQGYDALLRDHIADYSSLMSSFTLSLPDTASSSDTETADLVARYTDNTTDPFLESLLFDYSRHLLVSSSREGSLPANLQGRWTEQLEPAWSGDYHANINLQMNYWAAEQTGLGVLSRPLFAYIANTWAPRGGETARLLYNGSGWVAHDEMNIFGYTGMKNDAQWANYPASAAWMMQHAFDHYDYARNLTWLRETGYPLLRAVASFWTSQLREDLFSRDGTLVAVPCNSPEQGPTTFGCAHHQQLIRQVLDAVLAAAPLIPDPDAGLLASVSGALARLDAGVHVDPATGALREWKVPDAYLYDVLPRHRHLSHLVGWFPGHAVAGLAGGYGGHGGGGGGDGNLAALQLQDAVRASLVARGDGADTDGDGGDFGWPKAWRAACWARLNDSARAHGELRLAAAHNVAPNLLSMYAGRSPPFQIDMNLGWAGAVLGMLVVDLPAAAGGGQQGQQGQQGEETRTVVLGPAIPDAWGGGSVKGLRTRGGGVVDFEWDERGVVTRKTVVSDGAARVRFVNVNGEEI